MFARVLRIALIALLTAVSGSALSQGTVYPSKPVRLVVPYTPGASNDTLSRATAQSMSPLLGQSIVIDNRPGAG
ncbi:MAG: tripartite tricarboxylate transporter substrate binding protein, partial [Burkholderiales bacterium]